MQCNGNTRVKQKKGANSRTLFCLWPRQESNLDPELRKLIYYPLYYEAGGCFLNRSQR
jgi:hypothetical protein